MRRATPSGGRGKALRKALEARRNSAPGAARATRAERRPGSGARAVGLGRLRLAARIARRSRQSLETPEGVGSLYLHYVGLESPPPRSPRAGVAKRARGAQGLRAGSSAMGVGSIGGHYDSQSSSPPVGARAERQGVPLPFPRCGSKRRAAPKRTADDPRGVVSPRSALRSSTRRLPSPARPCRRRPAGWPRWCGPWRSRDCP
jgi:hypothetical protein